MAKTEGEPKNPTHGKHVAVITITNTAMVDPDELTKTRRRLFDYLRRERLASPSQMAEDLDRSADSCRVMLGRMLEDEQVVRPLRGYYTTPEIASELGLGDDPENSDGDSEKGPEKPLPTTEEPARENPVGPRQAKLFEELSPKKQKRREKTAILAGALAPSNRQNSSEEQKENPATLRASDVSRAANVDPSKIWGSSVRTDFFARVRWWVAEKLAWAASKIIPQNDLRALKNTLTNGA
jgi:hypothetical protein